MMTKMKQRWISILLIGILLITNSFPAYADIGAQNRLTDTAAVTMEEKAAVEENVVEEQVTEKKETEQDLTKEDLEEEFIETTAETFSEESAELACNYLLVENREEVQSVILEVGNAEEILLTDAVLSYRDGNGEVVQVAADVVAENLASFQLALPEDPEARAFLSVESFTSDNSYLTQLEAQEEMGEIQVVDETSVTEPEPELEAYILSSEGEIEADSIEQVLGAVPATYAGEEKAKKHVVVIDPGHGGVDGGADSKKFGFEEADLVLKIAKYCEAELKKYPELEVYMTRYDDTYVGLNERVDFAVQKNADILVSLHLNSFDSSTANGAEILVPRTGRYNSDVAENAEKLATNILNRLVALGLRDRGLSYRDSSDGTYPDGSKADYYAIVRGGMKNGIPSLIVEHAFLSSDKDKQYLDSDADLQKLGKADADGILQYFGILPNGEVGDEIFRPGTGWVQSGEDWYYYINNVKQVGWRMIGGIWYYFEDTGKMVTGWKAVNKIWYYFDKSGAMLKGWQEIDGHKYYFNEQGMMSKGWQEINGNKYYFNNSGYMLSDWRLIGDNWYYLDPVTGKMLTGMQEIKGKKYLLRGDGSLVTTGWTAVNKDWYYFKEDGSAATGWLNLGIYWYYCGTDGIMAKGWKLIDGRWYCFNGSGVMMKSWKLINNHWYYFNGSGIMQTDWCQVGDKWYYMDEDGIMLTGLQTIRGKKYLLGADGSMVTGWAAVEKDWYYFQKDGAAVTGWIELDGHWYYMDQNGIMAKGWKLINNKWYYMNGSGVMQTGWRLIGGKWYYLERSGAMCNTKVTLDGKTYFFYQNGVMGLGWHERDGEKYYLGTDGVLSKGFRAIEKDWYYFDPVTGAMQTGWHAVDKQWYYMNQNGIMYKGWLKRDGYWYYMNGSGVMLKGWFQVSGKWFYADGSGIMQTGWKIIEGEKYYFTENGTMVTGWQKVEGKWYYFDKEGAMKVGWQKVGSNWFYMDQNGVMQTGWQTIGGKDYYFRENGSWDPDAIRGVESLYRVEGESTVTAKQMADLFRKKKVVYPAEVMGRGGAPTIDDFCRIIIEEAAAENIKAEVVFSQAMIESGWLKFPGVVKAEQYNFCGLGATGNGSRGNSFKDVRTGIRAQVQHLKAYASDKPLKQACVDPRFTYVKRNIAPFVEWLGAYENPTGEGWAYAPNYGRDLLIIIKEIKAM